MTMSVTREQQAKSELNRLHHEHRNCPHCDGHGLVIVFHPAHRGERVGKTSSGRPFPAEVAAHCLCAVGQWYRERVDVEEQRRIPRVEDILAGRSRWLMAPPPADGRDRDVIPMAPTRSDINGMFGRPS